MSLSTPRELFVHELADIMSAEHIVLDMLPELEQESLLPEAKQAFKEHTKETQQQIKNVQAAFKELGEKPEPTTCYAAEGLQREHASLHEEQPTPEVLQMANMAGAAKTEHYEIASYTALIQMAKDLGEPEVARLLQENLDQEKAMAKRVETIAKELGKQAKADAKQQSGSKKES